MADTDYIYAGKDVRIHKDLSLDVCVRKGFFKKSEQWHHVMPSQISINTYHFNTIDTRFGRHSIADLGISSGELSHLLGIHRLDTGRAHEIRETASSIKGDRLQIDVEKKEFARGNGGLVYPFSAVKNVVTSPTPHILERWGEERIDVGELPISLEELTRLLDVLITREGESPA